MALAALFVLVAVADVADADAVFAALADPTRWGSCSCSRRGDRRRETSGAPAGCRSAAEAVCTTSRRCARGRPRRVGASGREPRDRPTPAPLDEAAAWMAEVGTLWDARLDRSRPTSNRSPERGP